MMNDIDPSKFRKGNYVMFPATMLIPGHPAGMNMITALVEDDAVSSLILPFEDNRKIKLEGDDATWLASLPLTEKILTALGFTRQSDPSLYALERPDIIMMVNKDGDWFYTSGIRLNTPLLQNLIFDMTGKFPEISPDDLRES